MDMTHRSDQIDALAVALAKAQGQIRGAVRDSINPHFKASYADLASVWDAIRVPLTSAGLSIVQMPSAVGADVTITTLLLHVSGQWIESSLTMTATQATPQGIGSCITYLRRYALAAVAGVAPEDDDGNAASQARSGQPQAQALVAPAGFADWLADLDAVADEGTEALKRAWAASKPALRQHLTSTDSARWDMLKARAAQAGTPA